MSKDRTKSQEKEGTTETDPQVTQILVLVYKYFKTID